MHVHTFQSKSGKWCNSHFRSDEVTLIKRTKVRFYLIFPESKDSLVCNFMLLALILTPSLGSPLSEENAVDVRIRFHNE